MHEYVRVPSLYAYKPVDIYHSLSGFHLGFFVWGGGKIVCED